MGKHWLKALVTIRRANCETGVMETVHPGNAFLAKNQEAMRLIADRQAESYASMRRLDVFDLSDAGVVIRGSGDHSRLTSVYPNLAISNGAYALAYPRTLLWTAGAPLRLDLIGVGFHRLRAGWQVAAPLLSYHTTLARDIGTAEERAITEEVIHDLRVMVYDTRCIYVRRCADTMRMMEQWAVERQRGNDERLAFMRAVYQVKPVVCALPVTWMAA